MGLVLVTGAAGFIGYHVAERCLALGHRVLGLDNLNDYYDVRLKQSRLARLTPHAGFEFVRMDLQDRTRMEQLFRTHSFERVIHLAAQAGVRYSLQDPYAYVDSNVMGTMTILEGCRHTQVPHLVYASSSSVYGSNTTQPFAVSDPVDHPLSIYAASKKANELMAHTYSHLYGIPTTGLRFFTVYGPWGRPDMALFKFTQAILEDKPIDLYNHGNMERDFTFVDDIATAVVRVMDHIPEPNPQWDSAHPDPGTSAAPFRIYNIGNHSPTKLTRFVEVLEEALGKRAIKRLLPMQPGDVPATFADVAALSDAVGFSPSTPIEEGIARFVTWYRAYHAVA